MYVVVAGSMLCCVHAVYQVASFYSHLQQSVIKKFVKVCAVLSDIQSLIDKEDKIANTSATNDQRLSLEAAVAVSKGVRQNMCNWVRFLLLYYRCTIVTEK